MANRTFNGPLRSLDRAVVKLYGRVVFGAASIASQNCLGFSVSRSAAGAYTIAMDDQYPLDDNGVTPLMMVQGTLQDAASQTGVLQIIADNSGTTTKTITVKWAVGGVATDPANGAVIYIEITLRNTSAPRVGT